MISNKEFAAKVLEETSTCFERLNDLLLDAQEILSDQEFRELRIAVGKVLGEMYVEVERPIHKAHPNLEPEALRDG
ncbi:hypothetical protein [Pelagibius sp. 7325]|uniref:hypothetical protein n=1 Tax=Pelagibius sp. 7325 TaxID=3131994 RepID=UPI0030EEECFA